MGCAYMAQAYFITLSDGELHDQDLTMKSADKLKHLLLQEKILLLIPKL